MQRWTKLFKQGGNSSYSRYRNCLFHKKAHFNISSEEEIIYAFKKPLTAQYVKSKRENINSPQNRQNIPLFIIYKNIAVR